MKTKNKQTQIPNPKEFVQELIRKSKLVKNFHKELEKYRIKEDRKGYEKKFKELMNKEERKSKWKKEYQKDN
jgi:hypothetical protein